jgi:hypothetical protein
VDSTASQNKQKMAASKGPGKSGEKLKLWFETLMMFYVKILLKLKFLLFLRTEKLLIKITLLDFFH